MPILIALTVIIQACFVVHALKTGRPYYWVFIIMAAPVLGCVAYYFVEVFPSTRGSAQAERAVNRAIHGIGKSVDPTRELRARAQDVETCGSVDNRLALARECLAAGLGEEAVKLVQSCLNGPFASDPQIKLLLVESALAAHDHRLGQQTIEHLRAVHPTFKPAQILLLKARLHEDAGEIEPALSTYAEALPLGGGEEVRVRYAQLLARQGRVDMARELFETTLKNADRLGGGYRDLHRDWVAAAKRELNALRA
ncbi:MAG TPA: hypothetical protein VM937_12230 [Burkholderiaceae bacterium]|jgi:hypothetical protein|nr:hypothetical protein [Burkholderiaceae bacterium]